MWVLICGLAVAPSLGLALLDALFNKRSIFPLYLTFAGPALAVVLCYPIAASRRVWVRVLGTLALSSMFLLGINWGFEEGSVIPNQGGVRSMAREVGRSGRESEIVVIDEGWGRSNPASVVYEQDPETVILCFGRGTNFATLWQEVRRYEDVWIVRSFDDNGESIRLGSELIRELASSGSYERELSNHRFTHFRRRTRARAVGRFPAELFLSGCLPPTRLRGKQIV